MKTINGGSAVKGGYYLSKSNWEIFPIARDGDLLRELHGAQVR